MRFVLKKKKSRRKRRRRRRRDKKWRGKDYCQDECRHYIYNPFHN